MTNMDILLRPLYLENVLLTFIYSSRGWIYLETHTCIQQTKEALNKEKRARELLRVTKENQAILQRITLRQPEYSAKKWQQIWDEEQKFIDNISHYPQEWWLQKEPTTLSKKPKQRTSISRSKHESRHVSPNVQSAEKTEEPESTVKEKTPEPTPEQKTPAKTPVEETEESTLKEK